VIGERLRSLLLELRLPSGGLGGRVRVAGARYGRPDSNLDLLVEWSRPASLLDHAGLRAELEERTGLTA
jgi:hypothetical protein